MKQAQKNNIVIVAHKFLTQPDDDLVLFLNEQRRKNILHIYHSFSDAQDRKSLAIWYKEGTEYKKFQTRDYKGLPEPVIYLKEMMFTFFIIFRTGKIWETYVGMDGLCILWGNILCFFKVIKRTIYWAIDFVPQKRFDSKIKNYIYHWVNIGGYKRADEMWDLSPRMAKAREKFLGIKTQDYRLHKVVPYGLWLERIKRYTFDECEKNTLVFMGHLIEKQGVQLVIQSIPKILQSIPDFKFKIIGEGNYRKTLFFLAKNLNVLDRCHFLGKIDNIVELENEIAVSTVAIAPYIKELDTWTYYADPGKIKTYLACGVPVLLTAIPWNAKEIETHKCGIIIEETVESIVEKVIFLMKNENNNIYRKNASAYSHSFSYKKIFNDLL